MVYDVVTARFSDICTVAVRKARVPGGIAKKSRKPSIAAARAPSTPSAISHRDPRVKNAPSETNREARSKTRLAVQHPMGIATAAGWSGWPYPPASLLAGHLACRTGSTLPPITVGARAPATDTRANG